MGLKSGTFITFEGAEGSGKSTQIRRAAAYFRKSGRKVVMLREPGGTKISEKIREILLDKKNNKMADETELLLYLAARAQIVREKILPALKEKKVVICDRYEDSTLAYQGFGRGIPLETIRTVSRLIVRGNLQPDLTFILDVDPKIGMKRGGRHDRIETQSFAFHGKVRKGFLALARQNPKRYVIIDALQDRETVAKKIKEKLNAFIGR